MTAASDPRVRENLRRTSLYGGLLIAGLALAAASRIVPYIDDAAYVAFRIADQAVHGFGLRFNRGAPPTESFGSPVWTALLALAAKILGSNRLPSFAMLLGIGLFVAVLALLLRLGRLAKETSYAGSAVARLAPAALWCFSAGALYAAVTGTGTMLLVLLVILIHGALSGAVPRWAAWIAGALIVWSTPAGLWFIVAGALHLHFETGRDERLRRFGWRLVQIGIASGVALELVRHHLFHAWLPNALHAWPPSLHVGLEILGHALRSPSADALLVAGIAGAVWGEPRHRGYLAGALGWSAVAFLGGDAAEGLRALQPALVLCALAAGGLGAAPALAGGRAGLGVAVSGVLVLADLAGAGLLVARVNDVEVPRRVEQFSALTWLQSSSFSRVGLAEPGEYAYLSPDMDFYDFRGIAGMGGAELFFKVRAPQAVVVRLRRMPGRNAAGQLAPEPEEAVSPPEKAFLADQRLAGHYRLLFVSRPEVENGFARAFYDNRKMLVPRQILPPRDVATLSDLVRKDLVKEGRRGP